MNARRAVKPLHIYQPGDIVADRYGIQSVIASGGMAEVYEVIDAQTGERRALKTPNDRYAHNKNIVARMVREARALGKLEHENLVKVYDAGVDEDQFFMVMELLDGVTLKQLASEQRLPIGVVLSLMEQAAIALHVLHLLGHIHRDIKPDNLMVSPRPNDSEHRLIVIDLGIAKFADHSTTTDGKTLGTVTYMAPEQALGERVDARADIYSLGVMMYELIAGEHPLQGDSRPTTPDEWMHRQLKMIPDPLDSVVKNLHPAVSNLVMRTIAKQPAQRFDSAAELAKQIRAVTVMLRDCGQLGLARLPSFDRAPPADGDSGPQPRAVVDPDERRASRLAFARTEAASAKPGVRPEPLPAPLPVKPEPPRVSADLHAPRARQGTVPMRGRHQTLPHLGGAAPSPAPSPVAPAVLAPAATEPALVASPVEGKWKPGPPQALRVLVAESESLPLPPPPKIKPPPAERAKSRQSRAERAGDSDVNAWLRALVAGFALSLVSVAIIAKLALDRDAVTVPTGLPEAQPVITATATELPAAPPPRVEPTASATATATASASASAPAVQSIARPPAKPTAPTSSVPPPTATPTSPAPPPKATASAPPPNPSALDMPFYKPKPAIVLPFPPKEAK